MLIIGERLNTSRKQFREMFDNREQNLDAIRALIKSQVAAGANYLDVNVGTRVTTEIEDLVWLAKFTQETVDIPLSIDTPNPKAAEAALKAHKGRPIINSISLEEKRYNGMISLVKQYKAGVIALCLDDVGMPETIEDKLRNAKRLVERLNKDGVRNEDIYLDPLVQPVSTDTKFAFQTVEAIKRIREMFPDVHISCGVSNVSYGLPKRLFINQAFIVMCIAAGMDTGIIDPNDEVTMRNIWAAEALSDKDPFCANWLELFRAGKLGA
jgi:5-methyltetrahydrofolate corrinoid/iron sulfur protein methyltransferase